MNNKSILLFLITILCNFPMAYIQAQTKKSVNVGVVYDGMAGEADELFHGLKNELESLLGSKYHIQIPDNKALASDWSPENAGANYDRLARDGNVDIIVGIGILTCSAIAQKDSYAKPVIMLGVFDPELQGLPLAADNKSGVHNLTYLLVNASLERDLDTFYEIFPYKKVGIVFYDEVMKFISADTSFVQEVMAKNGTSYELLLVNDNVDEVLAAASEDVDAFYLGYLGPFEKDEKARLIDAVNKKGIPSFASSVANVKRGVLAAVAPEENIDRIIRRISLNVESILSGEDAADLPVNLSFAENLTLNMQTANKIGFSPKFTILAKSEIVGELTPEDARIVTLAEVMSAAKRTNLDLKIEEATVNSSKKDVNLARTSFFPTLDLNALGLQIDKDRAKASLGQQAERTVTGTATVGQLIFSEQAMGNVSIQKHLLRAAEYSYEQLELDIILDAASAYFTVLRAKTGQKIQAENVELTRRNLEISKQREVVGYSGRSDVYRWESRLPTATTDLLAASNDVLLAKMQLNQLLNLPIDEPFIAQEISLSDNQYLSYLSSGRKYIDTPHSLKIYTDFLIEEALGNSPEIQQLEASIAALKRSRSSFKRERFAPTIGLSFESQHVLSRNGAGSDSNIPGLDPIDNFWSLGLNASLPIFQGGATRVNIQQTTIEVNKLEVQRAQLAQLLELNVRAAVLELIVKRVNLESSKKSAEFAEKSLELVQDEYAQGRVSIVNLVDAQNTALSANLGALDSEYEFLNSVLVVERAIGNFTIMSSPEDHQDFLNRFEAYFNNRTQ